MCGICAGIGNACCCRESMYWWKEFWKGWLKLLVLGEAVLAIDIADVRRPHVLRARDRPARPGTRRPWMPRPGCNGPCRRPARALCLLRAGHHLLAGGPAAPRGGRPGGRRVRGGHPPRVDRDPDRHDGGSRRGGAAPAASGAMQRPRSSGRTREGVARTSRCAPLSTGRRAAGLSPGTPGAALAA